MIDDTDDKENQEGQSNEEGTSTTDEAAPETKDAGATTTPETDDGLSEEERMAKEWEAMSGDDVSADAGLDVVDKTLAQDEIDSLLGVQADDSKKELRGLAAILGSSRVYYERLPMLEVVFDRLVRMLSTSLRNFTSENVEVSMAKITSYRFGDYLNSIPLPAMLGVFRAKQWDNQGLMFADSSLIYSCVDVLLGNRRGTPTKVEGRPYTTIERTLVERMLRIILEDFATAFDPISEVDFTFERLETNPSFAMIARDTNATIVVRMQVEMEDRGGVIDLVLPYATIEPVRELLLQNFMGEKFGRDSIWENHLATKLWNTDIELEVAITEQVFNLRDVLHWEVGQQIMLQATPTSPVHVQSGGFNLFIGKIGQKSGKAAIKIDDVLYGKVED